MSIAVFVVKFSEKVAHSASNERGIVAVRRVPVAAVEDADRLLVLCGQAVEEADEAHFIIDLWSVSGATTSEKSSKPLAPDVTTSLRSLV